jgi:hypothetical protein
VTAAAGTTARPAGAPLPAAGLTAADAATRSAAAVLAELGSTPAGLGTDEVARRRAAAGPNAVRTHRAQPWRILARQFRSAVLVLAKRVFFAEPEHRLPPLRRRGRRHRVQRRAARFSVRAV